MILGALLWLGLAALFAYGWYKLRTQADRERDAAENGRRKRANHYLRSGLDSRKWGE